MFPEFLKCSCPDNDISRTVSLTKLCKRGGKGCVCEDDYGSVIYTRRRAGRERNVRVK
jgi:hypothetical protein